MVSRGQNIGHDVTTLGRLGRRRRRPRPHDASAGEVNARWCGPGILTFLFLYFLHSAECLRIFKVGKYISVAMSYFSKLDMAFHMCFAGQSRYDLNIILENTYRRRCRIFLSSTSRIICVLRDNLDVTSILYWKIRVASDVVFL